MNNKNGKSCKKSPEKRKKNKLGIVLVVAMFLLVLVALLWFGQNGSDWPEDDHSGSEEAQDQWIESWAAEKETDSQSNAQGIQGENGETNHQSGIRETEPQSDGTDPSKGSATVIDAYLKEIDGELHLIKVLSDGTEIDEGSIDAAPDDKLAVTYTVIFMNYDGTILKTETVKSGCDATPPAAPIRDGYTFIGWSGSYSNVNTDVTVVAQYLENAPETVYYVVRFIDYDSTVLKTQAVEKGQSAKAPVDPVRAGYSFTGWDKAFTNVTADLTVTAQYEEIPSTDLTISVENKNGSAGETVKVAVFLKNNPGIVGMTLRLTYDESAMMLTAVDKGSALGEMTFTKPKDLSSGCKLPWDAEFVTPGDESDGEILILVFKISETAAAGSYSVSLSTVGDIIDNDLMPVTAVLRNGKITIK